MTGDNISSSLSGLYPIFEWGAMMSEHGGKTYRPWDPERYQQASYNSAAKLSEGDLVFFLLDTVARLDLSRFYAP
jgi:hypothetical protein